MTDKIKTERVKVNLKANRIQLLKKNFLIIKRKKLRTKIVTMNVVGSFNVPIRGHQDLFLNPIRNKLKIKRLSFF